MKTFRRTGLLTRTALGSALFMAAGLAQPAFAQVTVAGDVITAASNGGGPAIGTFGTTTTITANSRRTILNWHSLDLLSGDTLQYVVADRGDIVLNRVTNGVATIDGTVNSNIGSNTGAAGGNIWFSAPGGVLFGNNAVVNVGGLLATTASVSNADFFGVDTSYSFTGAPASSSVEVQGGARLNIAGGTLALIAPNVASAGTISDGSTGNNSDVLFGAAEGYTITFAPDTAGDLDLLSWTVPSAVVGTNDATPITVSGTITAGNIYVGAVTRQSLASALVDVSAVLTADGAIASDDGNIILVASGGIENGTPTAALGGNIDLAVDVAFANRDVNFSAANGLLTVNSQARSGRNYSVTGQDFTGVGGAFNPYLTTPGGGLTIVDTAFGLSVGNLIAPGNLSIRTTNGGGLTVNGPLTSSTGNITLNADGALGLAGNLVTSTSLRTVSLTAASSVQQTSGTISTGTVSGTAAGEFSLNAAGNSIGLIRDITAESIAITDSSGLSAAGTLTATDGNLAISVGAGALALNGATLNSGGAVTLGAATITLAPATITSAGSITLNAPVQVNGSASLTSNGGDVTFTGAVNSGGSAGNLTVASVGITNFQGAIGASTALASLTTNGSGITQLAGNVRTTGTQRYNQAVRLTGAVTINTSGSGVNFASTVDGAQALTINIPGATGATFGGAVGSIIPLTSFAATSVIEINGGSIRTSGSQTYSGPVDLGSDTTLTGSTGSFAYPLSGGGNDLTLNYSGASTLNGADFLDLRNLSVGGGGTTTLSGTLTTTGSQTFTDAITLGGNTTLAGTTGSFAGGVTGGGNNLTLNYSGASTINGTFTGIGALTTGGGGTTNLTGAITTSGAQTYNDAVVLTGATTLASTGNAAIALSGEVNGAQALTVNTTGSTSFGGAVGSTTALTSLTTNAGGTTTISGGAIRTSGAQTFNDAVTLGANAVLSGTTGSFASGIAGGGNDLTLNYSGAHTLIGSSLTGVRNLAIGGGGTTSLIGDLLTSGTQTFTNVLTLSSHITSLESTGIGSAGNISLSAVNGVGTRSSIVTDGDIAFNGAFHGLANLTSSARAIRIDGAISATDSINFAAVGDIIVNQRIDAPIVTGAVSLTASAGAILGTGRVSAGSVVLSGAGGVGTSTARFNTGAATLAALAGAAGSVYVQDIDAVSLNNVGGVANGAGVRYDVRATVILANGPITADGGTIALEATSAAPDGMFLNGPVSAGSAGAIVLASAERIAQGAGELTAATLSASAGSAISLGAATNDVAALGALSAASGITYRDANGFSVTGPVTNATTGGVTLTAASQSLTLAGNVTAPGQLVTLNASSGSVTQTAGIITAGTLASFISVDAILERPNQIDALGGMIVNSLRLTDVGGLQINGAVLGNTSAGDVTIRTTGGNLSLAPGGSVSGRNVALSTDGAFVNQSATGAIATNTGGHWVIYAAAPTGNTYGNLNSGNTAVWNGTIDTVAASSLTGDRYVFAYQPVLTFTSTGGSKVYGTDLSGNAASYYSVSGFHPGIAGAFLPDTAATALSGAPLVSSAGFAGRASVAGGPYAVTVGAGSMTSPTGYGFAYANSGLITVTPKAITGTATASSKTYDGTTAATGGIGLTGVVAGDQVSAAGNFAFADKSAGIGKTVTVSDAALSGADAGNYTLSVPASVVADILQKAITGTATASSKTYDGTTAATGSVGLTGVVTGDQVSASGNFAFGDKNAGTGKTVTVSGATLSGADAGNYTLSVPASVVADIIQKAITGTATASSKTYDGTTAATGSVGLTGVVTGDQVSASGNFAFGDKNAGTGKTVTVSGATLSGADAGNYTLSVPASVVADIIQKAITGTATASSKTYDGTTAATGSIGLTGVVAGDQVSAAGNFAFADKNAGTGKPVTVSGAALSGADAGNYTLSVPASVVADILQKAITGTATANSKTYDGTTAATGSIGLTGVVAGDQVSAAGNFAFADKNAGIGKTVTVSGAALSGADAGNYTLSVPASVVADILQKAITGTATASSKTYDGTTAATGSIGLTGVVAGDQVSVSGDFAFADKNAGTDKTVTVSRAVLSGADAGNYTLSVPATTVASILKKALSATASAQSKTYDGSTATSGSVTLGGAAQGDSVSAAATFAFADPNAGGGKTVQITGATLAGADAANYSVVVPATTVADILKRAIAVAANSATKVAGSADPELGYSITSGSLVAGDSLTGGVARQQGEAVGSYAIEQGTLAASANYLLSFTGSTLTIQPAPADPRPSQESVRQDLDGFLNLLMWSTQTPAEEVAPLTIGDGSPEPICSDASGQPCSSAAR